MPPSPGPHGERAFRQLMDGLTDYAFFLLDRKGCMTDWTTAAERLFGYAADELRGKHFSILYPTESFIAQHPEQVLQMASAHGRFEDAQWQMRRDASRFWTESVLCPVRTPDGDISGYTHMIRDISERRKSELLLRQKDEELAQARKMEAIGRLVGGVAHDFNNFITGIIGLADGVQETLPLEDARREDIADIVKLANRASALTRELLAFSRKQTSSPQVVSVNALIGDKKNILSRMLPADIRLDIQLDKELGHVLIDPRQFDQLLVNLVMNARDAMPQGGRLTLETRRVQRDEVSDPSLPPGPYTQFRIIDTGVGMDEETQKRLFEPFFTTKKNGKGTGLGLSTVFGIVKQHRGDITVQSEPDKGTVFTILWPDVDLPERLLPESPRVPTAGVRSGTILLVEDEEAIQKVARRALEKCGYRVLAAGSGPEALTLTRSCDSPIHLLLTDVVMGDMNGPAVAKAFHAERPNVPVLYMSAYSEDIIHQRGILEPGLEFIEKPFTPESLTQKVSELLQRMKAP